MPKPKTGEKKAAKPAESKTEKVPNEETREAIRELREGGGTRYESVAAMIKDILG